MFLIRHKADGLFWMRIPPPVVKGASGAWIKDPLRAQQFLSAQDAFDTAHAQCPVPLSDLTIVELVFAEQAASA